MLPAESTACETCAESTSVPSSQPLPVSTTWSACSLSRAMTFLMGVLTASLFLSYMLVVEGQEGQSPHLMLSAGLGISQGQTKFQELMAHQRGAVPHLSTYAVDYSAVDLATKVTAAALVLLIICGVGAFIADVRFHFADNQG
eukprot:gnl/MRDRNA2_/MRDRNA2_143274_c0_seq1.p1 gnl/MRDRNA2_/MRDRNA2_143274_c0~~gnl/MRDRNA2_/MRDRNA2_143274_c0_seq1.p1  ORF type:complete len:143 (+),score=11.43 gnl/MRDRNA2_/MRDRNA2_143274_c0_seq1:174-602(+)